jgi:hypothetical protein
MFKLALVKRLALRAFLFKRYFYFEPLLARSFSMAANISFAAGVQTTHA